MTRSDVYLDENTRVICGNMQHRRFAYIHKVFSNRFGLLLASDMKNAREHLGRDFFIKETWLSSDEEEDIGTNRDRRMEIVASVFSKNMVPPSREEDLKREIKNKAKQQEKIKTLDESLVEIIKRLETRVSELEQAVFAEVRFTESKTEISNPWRGSPKQ